MKRVRHLFAFVAEVLGIRRSRRVRIRGDGRDAVFVDVDGHRYRVYTELGSGRTVDRFVARDSVRRVAGGIKEPVPTDVRDRVVALLCEDYDHRGVTYEVQ